MPDYTFYIWSSYGAAACVLLWVLLSSIRMLRASETRLKQLQNGLEPVSENTVDDAV